MAGAAIGPDLADGDLTGDVVFDMGSGCGEFDYGYTSTTASPPPPPPNEAPTSQASATPKSVKVGKSVMLSDKGSTDLETAARDLDYSWDFGDDDQTSSVPRFTAERGALHRRTRRA